MSVLTVITATTGAPCLVRAVRSVREGLHECGFPAQHLLVVDGEEASAHVAQLRREHSEVFGADLVLVIDLPANVGGHGWNGHRVYAAAPWLVHSRYVSFLDEDNWYEPRALGPWVRFALRRDLQWSHCLRTVHDAATGDTVGPDVVESLGALGAPFFIDTNCYLIRRDVAVLCSACWAHPFRVGRLEADRAVAAHLRERYPDGFAAYPHYLLHYTAGSTRYSVNPNVFASTTTTPTPVTKIYVFHFSASATKRLFRHLQGHDRASVWDEWCLTIYDELARTAELVNGYEAAMPGGALHGPTADAVCVFSMCHPEEMPTQLWRRRDLVKVLYAFESPNARHAQQWSGNFLAQFDAVISYWHHIWAWPRVVRCPMVCHPARWRPDVDGALLSDAPQGATAVDVGIVLEDRPGRGTYRVCGATLRCLDHLRGSYAQGLALEGARVVAYGPSWRRTARPGVHLGDCGAFVREAGHAVQLLRRHTYALVLENCDAAGYVSEKLVDALCAGCVPLYYGNNDGHPALVPKDLYVDLREERFDLDLDDGDGQAVARLYEHLCTEVDPRSMRLRAREALPELLRRVSAERFAQAVRQAVRTAVVLNSTNDDSTLRLQATNQPIELPHSLPRVARVLVAQTTAGSTGALTVTASGGARAWPADDPALRGFLREYNLRSAVTAVTARDLLPCPRASYAVDGDVFLDTLQYLHEQLGVEGAIRANDPMLLATLCLKQAFLQVIEKAHV